MQKMDSEGNASNSFTFTEATHIRLNKKKPEAIYRLKTLKGSILNEMLDNSRIKFLSLDPEENILEFELQHCDVSIANALRRIMLADVPCVAIDDVYIKSNTGVMQDEMLAHRLGLVPIFHPGIANFHRYDREDTRCVKNTENTLVFRLDVKCNAADLRVGINDCMYKEVTTKDLHWIPQTEDDQKLHEKDRPKCMLPDIVITRLGRGQAISLEAHATLGTGAMHAKWSPVATASYRMYPEIRFKQPGSIKDDLARKLVNLHGDIFELKELFPEGHFSDIL